MYCSSCGTESAPGLSYCNRCGANLNISASTTQFVQIGSLTKPTLIVGIVMVILTLGGFTALIEGAAKLALYHMGEDAIIVMLALGMGAIITCDILLISQLSRMITAALHTGRHIQPKQLPTNEPLPKQQLHTATDYSMPSVTEHTTRTLLREK